MVKILVHKVLGGGEISVEEQRKDYYLQEDEIDLYELFLKLKKRWRVILGTVLIFLIFSVGYILIAKPIYKSSFVIKIPEYISSKETTIYINKIKRLLKEKRYEDIAKILRIRKSDVLNIYNIESKEIKKVKDLVKVSIEVHDPILINKLTNSIITYLNENKFFQERFKLKKKEIKEKILFTSRRLKALKEVKKIIYKVIEKGSEINFNPGELDLMIHRIETKLISLKTQLKLLKGFEISVKPIIPKKPDRPKKVLIISVSFISALFLGIFIAIFLEWLEEEKRKHLENSGKEIK